MITLELRASRLLPVRSVREKNVKELKVHKDEDLNRPGFAGDS